MQVQQLIPVLRIFDYDKAMAFYRDWLCFELIWEHEFEPGMPRYIEVRKGDAVLHLSEHHGDATPGSKVFVWCTGLLAFHKELLDKRYNFNRPGISETFYGSWCVDVIDPFGNRISFNEKRDDYATSQPQSLSY